MEEDGIEDVSSSISARLLRRRSGGGDSTSRWMDGSEVDSESPPWSLVDDENRSEGHGSGRRRLPVKKANRVDSFDVEAMVISGSHGHHDKEVSIWQTLGLAFQTLGVVYGDMGTLGVVVERNYKKSWADMEEEDEQILLESTGNWNGGDEGYDDGIYQKL
ncbi:hypothetical protein L1887_19598 [Cichorium endivia]|nr:hypothetical protein L1887_19598 [Cichorium endivia]